MLKELLQSNVSTKFDNYNVEPVKQPEIILKRQMGAIKSLNEPSRNLTAIQSAANHNFEVVMEPVETTSGLIIPDKCTATKSYDGTLLGNGVVTKGYRPCQPNELYDLADHLLSLNSDMTVTDVIDSHSKNMIGLQFNRGNWSPTEEFADRLEDNILLFTTFDGTKSTSLRTVSFRPACDNQYGGSNHLFSIRHTSRSEARIMQLKALLTKVTFEIEERNRKIQSLVNKHMSSGQASDWFSNLLLNGKDKAELKGRALTTHTNKMSDFQRLLNSGAGCEAGQGTAYAAFNAMTNYTTHERATRVTEGSDEQELRWESNLFGSAANFAQNGFDQLVAM